MLEDRRVRLGILVVLWAALIVTISTDLVSGALVYAWDVALLAAIWFSVRWGRRWWQARAAS